MFNNKIQLNFNKLRISSKVSFIICSIIFIGFVGMSAILLTSIYNKSMQNAEDTAKYLAISGKKSIEENFYKTVSELNTIRDTILYGSESKSLSRTDVINLLRKYLSNSHDILGFYTLWQPDKFDGQDAKYKYTKGHDHTGRLIPYLVKTSNRIDLDFLRDYEKSGIGDYYLIPKQTGKMTLLDPYIYKINDKDVLLTSLTMPVFARNKSFVGIVGADFEVDYLQGLIKKLKPMGGYSAIIDMSGKFVAHGDDPKLITQEATKYGVSESILEKIKKGEEVKEYVYSQVIKKEVLRLYVPIHIQGTNTYWSFLAIIPKDIILADFYFYFKLILGIMVVLIGAIIFVNIQFIKKLLSPLEIVNNALVKISNGDLKVEIDESDLSNDEIGSLAKNVNYMTSNLRNLVGQVNKTVEEISASSEEMHAAADQTNQGAQQVSMSIAQLAMGTGQVSTNISELSEGSQQISKKIADISRGSQQIAESITQLASGVQQISKNVDDGANNISTINKAIQSISTEAVIVAKLGNETEGNANAGKEHIKKAVYKIGSIREVSTEISNTISELGKLSSEIETIADLIKNIAGQTNLLALNAAIEAARAGEHGKGFAVVAEEVKKLAEQSAEATDKINSMIKEIQQETNIAVNTMNVASSEVDQGVTVINDAGDKLVNIIEQIKTANERIQHISGKIKDVTQNSDDVVKMMESISAITEETAATAEEISSISQEQTASLEEINASSTMLTQIADDLNKQVSVFKI